jgi:hypothetical protein
VTAVQLSFEQVAEQVAALPATGVQVDPRFGHIRVGDVVFADLHSVLNVWTYGGCDLTPADARALGEALVAWTERHSTPDPRTAVSSPPKPAVVRAQTNAPNTREAARSQRTASPAHPKPTERNQRT